MLRVLRRSSQRDTTPLTKAILSDHDGIMEQFMYADLWTEMVSRRNHLIAGHQCLTIMGSCLLEMHIFIERS